jgi:aspartate aminotransferase-like enzyme
MSRFPDGKSIPVLAHALSFAMTKKRLMTPGPTQVPEEALLAMARQVTHHRTPEFRALFAEVLDGLKYVFQTAGDVIVLASSGTGGMEAAVVNLVPRGAKAIVLEAGVFGRRWSDIGRAFGIEVVRLEVPWGEAVLAEDVEKLLKKHPDATAVFGTLMESSTGVAHDIRAIGQVVAASDALFVVDAISGAGVVECRTDAWGIDVLVVGSQKALMLPPGLAFLAVSPAAWRQIDSVPPQAFYFDLKRYRQKLHGPEGPETPFTPAPTLVAALAESLKLIRAAGIERIWERATILSRAARAGIEALGLALFAARPAEGLTAVRVPEPIEAAVFLRRLEERFGVKLAGGQAQLKGRIFRLAHLGLLDEFDILGTLAAMELVLDELGWPTKLGSAVAAASGVLRGGE